MTCKEKTGMLYEVCKISKSDEQRDNAINSILAMINKVRDETAGVVLNSARIDIVNDSSYCHTKREFCNHLK